MFKIPTILVPVLDPATFVRSPRLVHQIAWLARRFHSEVVLLHVLTDLDYPAGALERGHNITSRDLRASAVQLAETDLGQVSPPEFDGLAVTRILLRGEPGTEIVQTALDRDAGLIMLPAPGDSDLFSFLTGSVTTKVLRECVCPVWMCGHGEESREGDFSVHHILCSVELTPHSRHTLVAAVEIAAAMGAWFSLVHITTKVESWGPGGTLVNPAWKKTLQGIAEEEIAKLQQEVGTQADVIIDSGNVPELLNQAALRTNADLLIVGRMPGRSHLGDNGDGLGIVRESRIPVLSV